MSGGMLATLQFFADLTSLHLHFTLHTVGNGRFAHTGRSCNYCCFSIQYLTDLIHSLSFIGTGKHYTISASSVDFVKLFHFILVSHIFLVEADNRRNFLLFHHDQKAVQKKKVRLWVLHGKNQKCLIYVSNSRADKRIAARKNGSHTAFLLLLIQNGNLHIITYQRLEIILSKNSFCLTFVNIAVFRIDIIEACNSFNDLSLHGLLNLLKSKRIMTKFLITSIRLLLRQI